MSRLNSSLAVRRLLLSVKCCLCRRELLFAAVHYLGAMQKTKTNGIFCNTLFWRAPLGQVLLTFPNWTWQWQISIGCAICRSVYHGEFRGWFSLHARSRTSHKECNENSGEIPMPWTDACHASWQFENRWVAAGSANKKNIDWKRGQVINFLSGAALCSDLPTTYRKPKTDSRAKRSGSNKESVALLDRTEALAVSQEAKNICLERVSVPDPVCQESNRAQTWRERSKQPASILAGEMGNEGEREKERERERERERGRGREREGEGEEERERERERERREREREREREWESPQSNLPTFTVHVSTDKWKRRLITRIKKKKKKKKKPRATFSQTRWLICLKTYLHIQERGCNAVRRDRMKTTEDLNVHLLLTIDLKSHTQEENQKLERRKRAKPPC